MTEFAPVQYGSQEMSKIPQIRGSKEVPASAYFTLL
jgi:hypothetical protein